MIGLKGLILVSLVGLGLSCAIAVVWERFGAELVRRFMPIPGDET